MLSIKAGKDTAETFTSYIEEKIKDQFVDNFKILATKEDIGLLKEKSANDKTQIKNWMFIFWIGQEAVTFEFILLFSKNNISLKPIL